MTTRRPTRRRGNTERTQRRDKTTRENELTKTARRPHEPIRARRETGTRRNAPPHDTPDETKDGKRGENERQSLRNGDTTKNGTTGDEQKRKQERGTERLKTGREYIGWKEIEKPAGSKESGEYGLFVRIMWKEYEEYEEYVYIEKSSPFLSSEKCG